jgi:hypothetical protein
MLTVILFLYLACLPLCLYCATLGVLSAGLLTKAKDQPDTFRFFAWMMSSRRESASEPTFSPVGKLTAVVGLGLANFVPVIALVTHKNGIGPVVAEIVYFLVVAAWTANVVSAIRRTRSPDK